MNDERARSAGNGHPSAEDFLAFLLGELSGLPAGQVFRHWLAGCPSCREKAAPLAVVATNSGTPVRPADYDEAIGRAYRTARIAEREFKKKERLLRTALVAVRKGLEPRLGLGMDAFVSVEAQLAYSWELRFSEPQKMLRYTRRAVVEAFACASNESSSCEEHDLLCRALVEYSNALRVNNQVSAAQEQLGRAFTYFTRGTKNELLMARLLDIQANIMADLRRYDLAHEVIGLEIKIYRRQRLSHLIGQALISKAKFYIDAKEPARGIPILREARRLLVPGRDLDLELATQFNLAWAAAECGDFREARKSAWGLAQKFEGRGQRMSALRARWLEGKIHFGLNEFEKAAREFDAVREGFSSQELPYDTALVTLELAVALREMGDWATAEERLLEALAAFGKLALNDYFRLTLATFQDCFLRRQVTAQSLIEIVAILRQVNEEAHRDERIAYDAWKWAANREARLEQQRDRNPRHTE